MRQTRLEGTAVVETRVRIPQGDAVQRIHSVADAGGLTIIEVTNESPLPIAVAFTTGALRSVRPPTAGSIEGIDLPEGSVVFPVGHHASVVVAIAHDGSGAGALPEGLAPAGSVARGWVAMSDRASRFVLPDEGWMEAVVAARCELALGGPPHPDDDPAGFLVGAGQLVRMGERADPWVPDVAAAAEQVGRSAIGWRADAALDGAAAVFAAGGEKRALRDLAALRARIGDAMPPLPSAAPEGLDLVVWLERRFADRRGWLLADGWEPSWLGAGVEVYGVPVGASSAISYAVRWHGERPAVLWEVVGDAVSLSAPVAAPGWSTDERTGDALWPAPPGHRPLLGNVDPDEPVSFS